MKSPVLGYEPPLSATHRSASLLLKLWDRLGMLLIFLLIFLAASVSVDRFFSENNFITLLLSVTSFGILSCTMLFCLAGGDFDLSIGSVIALGGIVAATVVNATHSVTLGIISGIAAGAVIGLLNGVVIAIVGINALITTLATMQIARGLALVIPDGQTVGIAYDPFFNLGNNEIFGIPNPIWLMGIFFVAFGVLLHFTIFGRNTLAIGGNSEAANLAGVAVRRSKVLIFTLQGAVAGFTGVLLASRLGTVDPFKIGQTYELYVISACVLGGVSLTGGIGTILGVIVGVLIMGTVQNILDLKQVQPFYQYIVSGGILLSAVLLDRLKQTLAARQR